MTASPQETQRQTDERFMRRCLQLARNGQQNAKPNPMVGAVIVAADGRIIGEGYHVRCGKGHAEVNAFASVRPEDEALLKDATMYVSLEPCSHWGKTPPCADLIVRKGIRRVVCGCVDPFAQVQGRGIKRMREAGIDVTVGVLESECLELNHRFMTVNTEHRPYIILKWAMTENGMMAGSPREPLAISTPFTKMLVHKLRAENDAILVGHETVNRDHPQLNIREWSGRDPERLVLAHDREGMPAWFECFSDIDTLLTHLYDSQRQSLIVEGGAVTLQGFLDRDLWDEIRVETAPFAIVDGVDAPRLPGNVVLVEQSFYDGNIICRYHRAPCPTTSPMKP